MVKSLWYSLFLPEVHPGRLNACMVSRRAAHYTVIPTCCHAARTALTSVASYSVEATS